jgi:hypothetical protein
LEVFAKFGENLKGYIRNHAKMELSEPVSFSTPHSLLAKFGKQRMRSDLAPAASSGVYNKFIENPIVLILKEIALFDAIFNPSGKVLLGLQTGVQIPSVHPGFLCVADVDGDQVPSSPA